MQTGLSLACRRDLAKIVDDHGNEVAAGHRGFEPSPVTGPGQAVAGDAMRGIWGATTNVSSRPTIEIRRPGLVLGRRRCAVRHRRRGMGAQPDRHLSMNVSGHRDFDRRGGSRRSWPMLAWLGCRRRGVGRTAPVRRSARSSSSRSTTPTCPPPRWSASCARRWRGISPIAKPRDPRRPPELPRDPQRQDRMRRLR